MDSIQVQEPEKEISTVGYLQVDRPGNPELCHSCLTPIRGRAWLAVATYGDGECYLIGPLCEECASH
jgi:hypothetical protein